MSRPDYFTNTPEDAARYERMHAEPVDLPTLSDLAEDDECRCGLVVCQGCGAVRDGEWLGKAHNCWRNEDGSYEEGGTFQ